MINKELKDLMGRIKDEQILQDPTYCVLTLKTLVDLAKSQAKHNFNRQLEWKALPKYFDKTDKFYLQVFMLHNETEWRCMIYCKDKEGPLMQDVSIETMKKLKATGIWVERGVA